MPVPAVPGAHNAQAARSPAFRAVQEWDDRYGGAVKVPPSKSRSVRMPRVARATAVAAVSALLLTGCAVWESAEGAVTDVYQGVVAHQELNKLTDELRLRNDVVSAESTVTPVEKTASVSVELIATASANALAEVAARVDAVLRSDALTPFERQFSVRAGESRIHHASFGDAPVDFAAEIAHWNELQALVGAELSLELDKNAVGVVVRVFSTRTDATVSAILQNYDAIETLGLVNGAGSQWRLPGVAGNVDGFGPLPDPRILSLLADVSEMTNLLDASLDEEPPGFVASLSDGFPPGFSVVANAPGTAVDSVAIDQLMIRVVQGAIATGMPTFRISVQTFSADSVDTASFYVGQCEKTVPPTLADEELFDAIAAAGVVLPTGAAGGCLAFEAA